MKAILHQLVRAAYGGLALAMLAAFVIPALAPDVLAYGLPTNRSVEMSSSTAGATATYTISFKTATAGAIEGIDINFCDDSPIIGQSCQWTSGKSIGIGSAVLSSIVGPADTTVGASNWKLVADANSGSAGNGVILALSDSNASDTTSVGSGTTVTIVVTTLTNPNYTSCGSGTPPNCTFYARMLDYTTTAPAASYASASIGAPTDAGGAAMSTAATIAVTAKVQEQLSFCVYTTGGCGTNAGVTLGNAQGVLSTTLPSVDKNTFYTIQTNASQNANVNVEGTTLTSGASTIAAETAAAVYAAGTSQFGLCDYSTSGSNLSFSNAYNGNNGGAPGVLCSGTTSGQSAGYDHSALFYLGAAAQGTYGDTIATCAAGGNNTGNVVFLGSTSASQTAGIYATTMQFIATGTF